MSEERSVTDRPPVSGACKVCEGWGAYCDDHRPPVSGEPHRFDSRGVCPRCGYSDRHSADFARFERIRAASTGAALDVANEIKAILNRLPEARANPIWYEPTNGPDTRIKGMFAPLLARLAEQEGEGPA